MKTTESRVFSPDEANRMLPLVRVIVRDIRDTFHRYSETKNALGKLRREEVDEDGDGRSEDHEDRSASLERQVQEQSAELKTLVRELSELGVLIKDPVEGIVNFPFHRDDEAAFLCWKDGEEKVSAWHGVEESWASRRPLESAAPTS